VLPHDYRLIPHNTYTASQTPSPACIAASNNLHRTLQSPNSLVLGPFAVSAIDVPIQNDKMESAGLEAVNKQYSGSLRSLLPPENWRFSSFYASVWRHLFHPELDEENRQCPEASRPILESDFPRETTHSDARYEQRPNPRSVGGAHQCKRALRQIVGGFGEGNALEPHLSRTLSAE